MKKRVRVGLRGDGFRVARLGRTIFRWSPWMFLLTTAVVVPPRVSVRAAGIPKVVMVTGDHAPDGNGVFTSNGLIVGGLNDAGQVVFSAQLVSTAQGATDNAGVFRGDSSTLVQIARSGQGFGAGEVFVGLGGVYGRAALNNVGEVAFPALLSVTDAGGLTGLFRGAGTPESLRQMVRQGQPVPSGNGVFGVISGSVAPPTLNNTGQVAFYIPIERATNSQSAGVFRSDGTAITPIAVLRSPAPNGSSYGLLSAGPVLNDGGKVGFATSLYATPNAGSGYALALGDGASTSLYALTGQSTPDGNNTFNSPGAPFVNESGQIAFVASAKGVVGSFNAIYFANGAILREVARTGQSLPGFADQTVAQFAWLTLNNAGQIAFTAATCCTAGIFRWNTATGALINVALKGQAAPDGNGTINLLYSSSNSPVELNDFGQIAFGSAVIGGSLFNDFGIFFYDGRIGLVQIARYGDPLLGSSVTGLQLATGASRANPTGGPAGRCFSPLNNRGQVAFGFGLADGRAGVAVWTPPAVGQAQITGIAIVNRDVHVAWTNTPGSSSVIQASATASGTFKDVSGKNSGPGPNAFVEIGGATNRPGRFYRVRLGP